MGDKEALLEVFRKFNDQMKEVTKDFESLKQQVLTCKDSTSSEEQAKLNCGLSYSTHALFWSM